MHPCRHSLAHLLGLHLRRTHLDLWIYMVIGSMDPLAWMGSACAVQMLSTSVYSGNLPEDDGVVLGMPEQMSRGVSPRPAKTAAGAAAAAAAVAARLPRWADATAGDAEGAEEGAGGGGGGGGRRRREGERGGRRRGWKDQESL